MATTATAPDGEDGTVPRVFLANGVDALLDDGLSETITALGTYCERAAALYKVSASISQEAYRVALRCEIDLLLGALELIAVRRVSHDQSPPSQSAEESSTGS